VEPEPTKTPSEEAVQEPTEEPTPEETTHAEGSGNQTIQQRSSPTAEAGGEATEAPVETNGTGGENATQGEATETPTEKPTEEPTVEPTATATEESQLSPGGPLAQATVVAKVPDLAGASGGLRFSPDGGAFAVAVPAGLLVAAADGTSLVTLAGSHPLWSPASHELLFQDADGGTSVWDRQSGNVISITDRTRPADGNVADAPAGWDGDRLLYLRTFPDAPDRDGELHTAAWDGSDDAILGTGPVGAVLAPPVVTKYGVLALGDAGWGLIALDGTGTDLGPSGVGTVGEPVASPFGSLVLYEADGQLVLAAADNPSQPFVPPVPCGGCGFAFSPSGEQFVVADGNGLRVYNYADGSLTGTVDGPAAIPGWTDAGIWFVGPGDPPTLRLILPDALTPS
jgi:hypothetical protein